MTSGHTMTGASDGGALRPGGGSPRARKQVSFCAHQQNVTQKSELVSGGGGGDDDDDHDESRALPAANLQLVEQLRKMLERTSCGLVETEIHSSSHYREIMNARCPNTCWRYLLQRDQDADQALELIRSALVWRQENQVDQMRASSLLKDLWLRSPIGFVGRTREGQELMYAVGKNFRKPEEPVRQMIKEFIIYLLFEWEQRHLHDLEQVVLIMDVTSTSLQNVDLEMANWFLSKMDYAPARLKAVYFVGVPLLLRPIFRLVINCLPARFRRIVHCGSFEQLVRANVNDDSIPDEVGGRAGDKWRRAPPEACWAHELPDALAGEDLLAKIGHAFSSASTREHLDRVYQMQVDYERDLKSTNFRVSAMGLGTAAAAAAAVAVATAATPNNNAQPAHL